MYDQCRQNEIAAQIECDSNFRVLRRIAIHEGRTCQPGDPRECLVGAILDVETTGLDPTKDRIIELAIRRFDFARDGRVLNIRAARSWCEDPGFPLDPEVVRLTGLTDANLIGRAVDESAVMHALNTADLVIAHNAAFDRKFIERRLPAVRGRPWACSLREIDWVAHGFEGRQLGWLMNQAGWFYDAHRALADVDAVMHLLQLQLSDGRLALSELICRASQYSWLVRATEAPFEKKDLLKARGYSWDAGRRVWWREIFDNDLEQEEHWLSANIYCSASWRPANPVIERVTWRERHQ